MDGDLCDNRPASVAERYVALALDLIVSGREAAFLWWAESSAHVRRFVIDVDPHQHFYPWTDAIVCAQDLCRVIASPP